LICFTQDIDLAACLLSDARIPRIPAESVAAFVEGGHRRYIFKFEPTLRFQEIVQLWERCQRLEPVEDDITWYIWNAFRYFDRLSAMIRAGEGRRRPAESKHCFRTVNTKCPAAVLAVAGIREYPEEKLAQLIFRDHNQCGFLLKEVEYIEAFLDPEEYCRTHAGTNLSAIAAGFFHRDRIRDFVSAMPARHVFREIGENGLPRIVLMAEPTTPQSKAGDSHARRK
jgi:hypothetical protein